MTLFHSARLRLTGWYILIIAGIVISFSYVIFSRFSAEIDRYTQLEQAHLRSAIPIIAPGNISIDIDNSLIDDLRSRTLVNLIISDAAIILFAGAVSYWLAGWTLKPIEDMVEEQKRFTSDASHELRTPLTSIKIETEVALRDKGLSLAAAKTQLKSNIEEVDRLRSLADSLLVLGRHSKTQTAESLEPVDLSGCVAEAIKKVAVVAKNKDIKINTSGEKLIVSGDRSSLCDLIIILLDNAVKYSNQNSEVNVTWQTKNNEVRLSVEDSGAGIKPDDLTHIFDRFYRADSARLRQDAGGHGLGLSIAKQIVENHHGVILVSSEVGKGTTFTVKIPLSVSAS